MLQDPERTAALEALNGEVLRNLTVRLFNQAQSTRRKVIRDFYFPREQIQELRNHLAQQNPYFGLWVVYKKDVKDHPVTESGTSISFRNAGPERRRIAFAHAMSSWKSFSLFSMTEIGCFPASPSSASGSFIPFVAGANAPNARRSANANSGVVSMYVRVVSSGRIGGL